MENLTTEKANLVLIADYDGFEAELKDVLDIIADKYNKADKQTLIVEVKTDGTVDVCGVSYLRGRKHSCMVVWDNDTNSAVENYTGEFRRVAFPVKMLTDILNRFKGLRRTEATAIKFDVFDRHCQITVYEKGAKYTEEDAEAGVEDNYAQASKFTIALSHVNERTAHELNDLVFVAEPEEFASQKLLVYLDFLYPQIAEEITESTDALVFLEKSIYVRTSSHILSISNGLVRSDIIPCLQGVKFNKGVVTFLQTLLAKHDIFHMSLEEKANQAVLLTIQVEGTVVTRLVPKIINPIKMEDYQVELPNRFTVDKLFLEDALRRVTVGNEPALLEFVVQDGNASIHLSNQSSTERYGTSVPVEHYEGTGTNFSFSLLPKFVGLMAATYMSDEKYAQAFPEKVILTLDYAEPANGRGDQTISFGVTDEKGLWNSMKIKLKKTK